MPRSRHLLLIAGARIYGLAEDGGGEGKPGQGATLEVYDLAGKKLGEGRLYNAPVEGEKKRQIKEVNGWATWDFSYGCPFTIGGDRIYVRSYDYLWCIGER